MKEIPRRVDKPWGYELIWAQTPAYVGKVLHIHQGESLSLQYHEVKDETIFLFSGEMLLWVGEDAEALVEIRMGPGDAFRVLPGTLHRMEAMTDCDVMEASTPHLDDVVRIRDRYGRVPSV